MQIYWMSSYMKFNSCGGVKTPWYFLKTTQWKVQVGFLSSLTKGVSLTIVNDGPSLTIDNETTNFIKKDRFEKRAFWKTIVLKTTIFKKRSFLKTIFLFSIFRRRFLNETIVFLKNENVNIPSPKCIICIFYIRLRCVALKGVTGNVW